MLTDDERAILKSVVMATCNRCRRICQCGDHIADMVERLVEKLIAQKIREHMNGALRQ